MTSEPAYSFTIPSIGDDLPLDCRLYLPDELHTITSAGKLRGAIVAHPYAPLGGCFDDAVVLCVKDTLIRDGYIVATFNFRGAGESAGRSSWTGHSETEDYISVVGLLVYYLSQMQSEATGADPNAPARTVPTSTTGFATAASPSAGASTNEHSIRLLLAGYSFGSLILARLPPVATMIERFETAEKGTAAGEIILRAKMLARQRQASTEQSRRPSTPRGRGLEPDETPISPQARSSPVTVGGEETDPSHRRRSRDSKHSTDIIRDVPNRIKTHIRRHSGSKHGIEHQHKSSMTSTIGPRSPAVEAAYLLISPVLLPMTTMLLPPGLPTSLAFPFGVAGTHAESGVFSWEGQTLLIFGADDHFTSSKRLRHWAEKLQRQSSGALQWVEVEGARHFWREDGVLQMLSSRVSLWDRDRSLSDS